jgi:hypothetical protein
VDDPAITRDQRIDPEMAMIAVLSASLPSLSLSLALRRVRGKHRGNSPGGLDQSRESDRTHQRDEIEKNPRVRKGRSSECRNNRSSISDTGHRAARRQLYGLIISDVLIRLFESANRRSNACHSSNLTIHVPPLCAFNVTVRNCRQYAAARFISPRSRPAAERNLFPPTGGN